MHYQERVTVFNKNTKQLDNTAQSEGNGVQGNAACDSGTSKQKFTTSLESLKILSDNWNSLFNNKMFSDVKIQIGDEIIFAHKVVMHARCPALLDEINFSNNNIIDLSLYQKRASFALLQYIYSGQTDSFSPLSIDEKKDAAILSERLNIDFIKQLLSDDFDVDAFYNQSTCSPPDASGNRLPAEGTDDFIDLNNSDNSTFNLNNSPAFRYEKQASDDKRSCINSTRPFGHLQERSPTILDESPIGKTTNMCKRKRKLDFDTANEETTNLDPEIISVDSNSGSPRTTQLSKEVPDKDNNNSTFSSIRIIDLVNDEDEPTKAGSPLKHDQVINISPTGSSPSKEHRIEDNSINISPEPVATHSNSPKNVEIICISPPASPMMFEDEGRNKNTSCNSHKNSLDACFQTSFPSISLIEKGTDLSPTPNTSSPGMSSPFEANPLEKSYSFSSKSKKIHLSSTPIESPISSLSEKRSNRGISSKKLKTIHLSSTPGASPTISSPIEGTPKGESSIIIKDATPYPDYSTMVTPELKEELKKFGLKHNLQPRQAKCILQYIYDQTHQVLPEDVIPAPPSSKEPTKLDLSSSDNETPPGESFEDHESDEFIFEESVFDQSKTEESESTTDHSSLKKVMIDFLRKDDELFTSILCFKPLLLKKFHKTIKECGIHCKIADLMDTLDNLGITYRVERPERKNFRGPRKKRKRKPK